MAKDSLNEMVIIQSKLNAPKNQWNNFGNYNYRSCEDILEALKPLLKETGCVLNISDEIQQVSDRIYVKATATLTTPDGKAYQSSAFAREPLTKKGQDESQLTGSASSYARKYALNGLFCIDDNKDADTQKQEPQQAPLPQITDAGTAKIAIDQCNSENDLLRVYNMCDPSLRDKIKQEFTARRVALQKGGAK